MCHVSKQVDDYVNGECLMCPECGQELVEKHVAFESPWYECPDDNVCGYSFDPSDEV